MSLSLYGDQALILYAHFVIVMRSKLIVGFDDIFVFKVLDFCDCR